METTDSRIKTTEAEADSKGEEIMMEALATVGSVVEVEDQAS